MSDFAIVESPAIRTLPDTPRARNEVTAMGEDANLMISFEKEKKKSVKKLGRFRQENDWMAKGHNAGIASP